MIAISQCILILFFQNTSFVDAESVLQYLNEQTDEEGDARSIKSTKQNDGKDDMGAYLDGAPPKKETDNVPGNGTNLKEGEEEGEEGGYKERDEEVEEPNKGPKISSTMSSAGEGEQNERALGE